MTELGPAGQALHDDYAERYDLDPGERETLLAACRTLDELGRLEAELASNDVMVFGARGVWKGNPLLDECRRHRAALAGLLASLRLNGAPAMTVSENASLAARARWRGKARSAS